MPDPQSMSSALDDLPGLDPSDPRSFMRRAQMVQLRMVKVDLDAAAAHLRGDVDKMAACADEADLLHQAMLTIREEQLIADAAGYPKPKKKRWWRRG